MPKVTDSLVARKDFFPALLGAGFQAFTATRARAQEGGIAAATSPSLLLLRLRGVGHSQKSPTHLPTPHHAPSRHRCPIGSQVRQRMGAPSRESIPAMGEHRLLLPSQARFAVCGFVAVRPIGAALGAQDGVFFQNRFRVVRVVKSPVFRQSRTSYSPIIKAHNDFTVLYFATYWFSMQKETLAREQPTEQSRLQVYGFTPPDLEKTACTISCDKLYVTCMGDIPKPEGGQATFQANGTAISHTGKGAGAFQHLFDLFYEGETIGHLLAHPNPAHTIYDPKAVRVELSNNILYRAGFAAVLMQVLEDFELRVQTIAQLDLAIDGLNHLPDLLNAYQKQGTDKDVRMVGARNAKNPMPKFQAAAFNHETMKYENFHIGNKATRVFVVYRKINELAMMSSAKTYIPEFWKANGLVGQDFDLFDAWQSGLEIWRLELRMKSEAVKAVKNFDLAKLEDAGYLASIFRTQANNFLDFAWVDHGDTNQRRNLEANRIPIIPYERLQGRLLEKSKRMPSDGLFKAKMTISGYHERKFLGVLTPQAEESGKILVREYVERYNLNSWLKRSLPRWEEKCRKVAATKPKPVTNMDFSLEDLTMLEYGT